MVNFHDQFWHISTWEDFIFLTVASRDSSIYSIWCKWRNPVSVVPYFMFQLTVITQILLLWFHLKLVYVSCQSHTFVDDLFIVCWLTRRWVFYNYHILIYCKPVHPGRGIITLLFFLRCIPIFFFFFLLTGEYFLIRFKCLRTEGVAVVQTKAAGGKLCYTEWIKLDLMIWACQRKKTPMQECCCVAEQWGTPSVKTQSTILSSIRVNDMTSASS